MSVGSSELTDRPSRTEHVLRARPERQSTVPHPPPGPRCRSPCGPADQSDGRSIQRGRVRGGQRIADVEPVGRNDFAHRHLDLQPHQRLIHYFFHLVGPKLILGCGLHFSALPEAIGLRLRRHRPLACLWDPCRGIRSLAVALQAGVVDVSAFAAVERTFGRTTWRTSWVVGAPSFFFSDELRQGFPPRSARRAKFTARSRTAWQRARKPIWSSVTGAPLRCHRPGGSESGAAGAGMVFPITSRGFTPRSGRAGQEEQQQ